MLSLILVIPFLLLLVKSNRSRDKIRRVYNQTNIKCNLILIYFLMNLGIATDYITGLTQGTSEWSDWIAIASDYVNMVWSFCKEYFSSISQIIVGIVQWIAKSEIIKDYFPSGALAF